MDVLRGGLASCSVVRRPLHGRLLSPASPSRRPSSCLHHYDGSVKRTRLILAALLLLAAGCDRGSHPRQTGRVAPDFTVSDGNHSVHLADYRGKVVVLNFWATWCIPCVAELPSLTSMQQQSPQVQVIAVSVDVDQQAYRDYLVQHKISLLTINDPAHRSADLYGTNRWPETYVIDQRGVIRRKFIGAQDWTSPEVLEYLRRL
jgi:cytochrome c biogenesis protein CcmG/thiol:disulfide interchange protein DsbE